MATSDRRPDPAQGIFETLLVVDGEPVELDAHLARLRRSLDEVYDADLPAGAREEMVAAARGILRGCLAIFVPPTQCFTRMGIENSQW